MLNTLESLEDAERLKNNFVSEIKEKISVISINLHILIRLEGNKKVIKSFGLIEIILGIIMNNKIL